MRIAIACSSLCCSRGGSERVATNLAGEMAARGHAVLLLSTFGPQKEADPVYSLPAGVRHLTIDHRGEHARIRRMREFLVADGTDAFLSMQSDGAHLLWAMCCMGTGIPFICSERVDPIIYTENYAWNKAGRYAVLAGADYIHELLPTYIDTVPEYFRHKTRVIPNAAPAKRLVANPVGGEHKKLLYLARLCNQKRPLLLFDAFKLVASKHPDWNLEIWGHGPLEKKLERAIAASGLSARVNWRGICADADKAYSEAQIYCLSSYFEGFPNTVLEAMNASLPVVGFECCKGVQGIVRDGETGLLAKEDTAQSLANALDKLMGNADLRNSMGNAAKLAVQDYAAGKIFDQWEAFFAEAAQKKGRTIMDGMREEPFASCATLSAAARREYLYRNFGETMPYSFAWFRERGMNLARNFTKSIRNKIMGVFSS